MFFWLFNVLMPFLAFGFGVYGLIRWINGRSHPGPPGLASRDKPVPVWATIVLIGLPLARYGIMVLGEMAFALNEEDWNRNEFADVQAFRRWYPESFVGDNYGVFLTTSGVLVLLDTLLLAALLMWAIRRLQRRASQRLRADPPPSERGPDGTTWPPPPKPPEGPGKS